MDPGLVGASGALVAAAILLVVMFALWRRARSLERKVADARLEADHLREVLAAAPDGLFLWDIGTGQESCSRRLAVLLDLPSGVNSRFLDIRDTFPEAAGRTLEDAVGHLRREGAAFDLLLPLGGRVLMVIGVRAGTAQRVIKRGQIFCRVHVEDIATVLRASMDRPDPGRIYNVADDLPSPPQDPITFACELLGVPPPPEIPFEQARLNPMRASFFHDSKRVRNDRIKRELGVTLRHPTYREGLRAILAEEG
ncbi:MAG: hypothetical protein H7841_16970 [Magnetospirillum sp. WYHS-4]